MELTEEQEEALDGAVNAFEGPEAFADALQDNYNDYFHEPFRRGHKTGQGTEREKVDELQEEKATLESKLEEKNQQLEQLKEEKPDIDEAIESVRQEEVKPLKEKNQELEKHLTSQAKESGRQRVKQHLIDAGLDEWTADAALERHLNGHVDVGDNFTPRYLQDPDNDVPVSADEEEAPKVLAENIMDQIPDSHKPDTEQGGPRSTEGKKRSGEGSDTTEGYTKQEVLSSDQKLSEFMGQFDDDTTAQEALSQLPDE